MTGIKPDICLILEREGVELRKRGKDLWGNCPIHKEKSPSFKVDVEKQRFKCFGCGASGDVIDLVMKINGLQFKDALNYLNIAGPLPKVSARKKRKRKALHNYEQWRRETRNALCDLHNELWHSVGRLGSMEEICKHHKVFDTMLDLNRDIEILESGNMEAIYGLYMKINRG